VRTDVGRIEREDALLRRAAQRTISRAVNDHGFVGENRGSSGVGRPRALDHACRLGISAHSAERGRIPVPSSRVCGSQANVAVKPGPSGGEIAPSPEEGESTCAERRVEAQRGVGCGERFELGLPIGDRAEFTQ
jgi:hypothetical protein